MPTPYGSSGAMAFSADELRVLRCALAIALRPTTAPLSAPSVPAPASGGAGPHSPRPGRAEEIQELFRLAESVDETAREGGRLRAFLLADLARYRAALPGSATGYVRQLTDALAAGHLPAPDDLAALRMLCGLPAGPVESARRNELRRRCEVLAERSVRDRLAQRAAARADAAGALPSPRSWLSPPPDGVAAARLVALPGGRAADEKPDKPEQPRQQPRSKPAPGRSPAPRPDRPIPTPAEAFPPRRRSPAPPDEPEQLATG